MEPTYVYTKRIDLWENERRSKVTEPLEELARGLYRINYKKGFCSEQDTNRILTHCKWTKKENEQSVEAQRRTCVEEYIGLDDELDVELSKKVPGRMQEIAQFDCLLMDSLETDLTEMDVIQLGKTTIYELLSSFHIWCFILDNVEKPTSIVLRSTMQSMATAIEKGHDMAKVQAIFQFIDYIAMQNANLRKSLDALMRRQNAELEKEIQTEKREKMKLLGKEARQTMREEHLLKRENRALDRQWVLVNEEDVLPAETCNDLVVHKPKPSYRLFCSIL